MVQRRKRSKNWISWVIILVLLIAAGVVVYLVWDNYFEDKKNDNTDTKVSSGQVEKSEKAKSTTETEKKDAEMEDEKKVKQYEGEDPNKSEVLTGAVTYAGVNGDNLMIRVNIDQYVESGTCSLGLRRAGANIYSAEASIVGGPATATCEGFDVPVAGLGNGDTVIVIYLNGGGKTGEITGEVSL